MMEMEMNADLGDDDGSESSQSSSEGSSASGTFCALEKDYARVLEEMKANEALAKYEPEYTKLFESLYTAHRAEKELSEKCLLLKEEAVESTQKIEELRRTVEENSEEIAKLKHEILNAMKLADAAHTREQNGQEVIENLRVNVAKLNQEIEQKNRQLAAEEESTMSKQKEGLLKEREKLVGEMETLRQRLKNMSVYTEELEKKTSAADQRLNELQEGLDAQVNEASKERRARQRAESELQQLQEELSAKTNDLEAANASMKAAAADIARLENLAKEQKSSGEKMEKEISKLMLKRMNLQTDYDSANAQIDALEKEIAEKDKQLRSIKQTVNRLKDESGKSMAEKESREKRLQKAELERSNLEQQLKQALTNAKNAETESLTLRKQLINKQQQIEILLREKSVLAHTKETTKEHIKRLNHQLMVCEQARKKIERVLDESIRTAKETKKQLEVAEKERDKYNLETQELAERVEDYISEVKLKQVEIFDYKKRLAEAEARHRQQQNLFETVRAERNSYSKSLMEAQDEIGELKSKLKIVSHQVEQLKEDIATKEADLVQKEFLLGRIEKEKESVMAELQSSRKEVSDLKREIEETKQEEKRLRQAIRQADMDISRQKKDIDNVMNEREILGTQLVRRNDELSLQYGRIKVLNGTLQRGEAQYSQRLEDIRLLKLEVRKLRTEKTLLAKNIENMADLRQEIFHLNRDLARERLKVVALEEELQTPLNIHRWRKLQGSDPSAYELVKKIQILQKRVIKMSADMIDKERKIKDTEKLYMNLREILSKQPGPQVAVSLEKTQKTLRERGKRMKCLIAELSMYEVQVGEYKIDMERMTGEMCELKRKYYTEKRKLQKSRMSRPKSMTEPILPAVTSSCHRRFLGGGFNLTTATLRNCFTIDSSAG